MKEEERVTIYCAGGCGRSVTLRRSRVNPADFYLCNSRADGQRCRDSLPPVPEGKITVIRFNSAGSFTGISYEVPSEERRAAIARANRLKRLALGIARPELRIIPGGKK